MPQLAWHLLPVSDIKEFLSLCRPCVGWLPLKHASSLFTLFVVDSEDTCRSTHDRKNAAVAACVRLGIHIHPLYTSEITMGSTGLLKPTSCETMLYCNDSATLPLRPGALDCVVFRVKDSSVGALHSSVTQLASYLTADKLTPSLFCVVIPGYLTVDVLVAIEETFNLLLAPSFSSSPLRKDAGLRIVTLRQLTPDKVWQCGPCVLGSVGNSPDSNGGTFGLVQLQRHSLAASSTEPEATTSPSNNPTLDSRMRLLHLLETSLYLDLHAPGVSGSHASHSPAVSRVPASGAPVLSAEDWDYLLPPTPSTCSLHLPNYYDDWRRHYPALRLLLENFDTLRAEAAGVSSWTPWPEYHFRDGGVENDWRVVPFLHTFPATDPGASKWIPSTCARCPAIVQVLQSLRPALRTALLSRLGPDTRLSAHTGWEDLANHVLRVHLTLVAPPLGPNGVGSCGTWVEGEVRCHRERDFIVFDDSKVHKAFNLHPTESRIVLIMDLVRPKYVEAGVAVGGHTEELDKFISAFQ